MLERYGLLRMARIIDYNRFINPSLEMLTTPGFAYEYVQFSIRNPLKNGGYCITHQQWRKATVNSPLEPHMNLTIIKEHMQRNEIRARKEMKTSELKEQLKEVPLQFVFENKRKVVVLPKSPNDQHEVYIKWSDSRHLYTNQYNLTPGNYEYQQWFNEKFNFSLPKSDWRYLLDLDNNTEATNDLYKYYEGVYTGNIEDLKKGDVLYSKEFGIDSLPPFNETKFVKKRIRKRKDLRPISTPRTNNAPDQQKMVCIKDPKNGNIIRVAQYYTGKFIKNGWTFVPKEEYKVQQKQKFEKRKDMSEGNYEEQLLKHKDKKRQERRGTKIRGNPNSPYNRLQTIVTETIDEKDSSLIAQETFKVKKLIPHYEYIPIVWEIKQDGIVIETVPFLDKDDKPIKRKKFIENVEEWITITRDVPVKRKTIKVLQIPSKKMQNLKAVMEAGPPKPKDSKPLLSIVKTLSKQLGTTKRSEEPLWKKLYNEFKIESIYETYFVTKRDSFGKVFNFARRKLVK